MGYGMDYGYPYDYGYGWGSGYSQPNYAYSGYSYPAQRVAGNYCTTPVRNCVVPTAEGIGAGCACHSSSGHLVEGHIAQ